MAKTTLYRFETCPLEKLGLARTRLEEFVLTIIRPANSFRPHPAHKLRRWAKFILLPAPVIAVGKSIGQNSAT